MEGKKHRTSPSKYNPQRNFSQRIFRQNYIVGLFAGKVETASLVVPNHVHKATRLNASALDSFLELEGALHHLPNRRIFEACEALATTAAAERSCTFEAAAKPHAVVPLLPAGP